MESTSKGYLWSRCDCYGVNDSYAFHAFTIYAGGILPVIASLGAVIAVLCLIVLGTLSALLVITHKYYKIIGIVIVTVV